MSENRKVEVVSLVDYRVGLVVRDLALKRSFERKGQKYLLDFDTVQQALYYPGVEYLFKQGVLGIVDMQTKIDLGLEPDGATEPENIIILNDNQRKRALTLMPMSEFKVLLEKLGYEQVRELAQYAIDNQLADFDRCDLIKKRVGIDVITSIKLSREDKEER